MLSATVKSVAYSAAFRSSISVVKPALPRVAARVTVTTPRSLCVPMSTSSARLVSALSSPVASSVKASATTWRDHSGAITVRWPLALRLMTLFSSPVFRCTVLSSTTPWSARARSGRAEPSPPRTSISAPAYRSRPRRTCFSAVTVIFDAPVPGFTRVPTTMPAASIWSTISPPATIRP